MASPGTSATDTAIPLDQLEKLVNATAVIEFFRNLEGADFIPDLDGDPETYDPAVWIFDFFDYMVEVLTEDDGQYAWELKNKGIKHLQVRFYFIKPRYWEYYPIL